MDASEEAADKLARSAALDPASPVTAEIKQMCATSSSAQSPATSPRPWRSILEALVRKLRPEADRVFRTALLYLDWADRRQAAVYVAETWAGLHPDSIEATHMRDAALSRSVQRQPPQLVSQAFDDIADDFDDRLVRRLAYRGPEQLAALLAPQLAAEGDLEVLDLGCGTGLCAAFLRPYARRLAGVDLSAGMLAKAAGLGLYDHLEVADLLSVLGEGPGLWDLLIAADTFPYLGALESVFDGAAQALRPGGLFAFSTESVDSDGYVLKGNGRFAQGPRYIQRLTTDRFEILAQTTAVLRREAASPVYGDFFLLQRLASPKI